MRLISTVYPTSEDENAHFFCKSSYIYLSRNPNVASEN